MDQHEYMDPDEPNWQLLEHEGSRQDYVYPNGQEQPRQSSTGVLTELQGQAFFLEVLANRSPSKCCGADYDLRQQRHEEYMLRAAAQAQAEAEAEHPPVSARSQGVIKYGAVRGESVDRAAVSEKQVSKKATSASLVQLSSPPGSVNQVLPRQLVSLPQVAGCLSVSAITAASPAEVYPFTLQQLMEPESCKFIRQKVQEGAISPEQIAAKHMRCPAWASTGCVNGDLCPYSHADVKEPCQHFLTKGCRRQFGCRFSHGPWLSCARDVLKEWAQEVCGSRVRTPTSVSNTAAQACDSAAVSTRPDASL